MPVVGSFTAKDQNGKNIWLFYTGMKDFNKIMPGEIYQDQNFNEYIVIRVDYPNFGNVSHKIHGMGLPTNIVVMERLLNEKLTKFIMLEDGPYSVAAIEELLLPLGFKIVFTFK